MDEGLFHCAAAGMERVVLGSHDGVMSWTVRVGAERSTCEQQLVSTHERFHHELHQSTAWGLLMAALASSQAGVRSPVWQWIAEGARTTHEAFATFFSVLADDRFPPLLAGNATYLRYQEIAVGLAAHAQIPDRSRRLAIDALLRSAMAPRDLAMLTVEQIRHLRLAEIADELLPDVRLSQIQTLLDRDGGSFVARALEHLDDQSGLARFRAALAEELSRLDVPTLTPDEHHTWAAALTRELNELAPGPRFALVEAGTDPVDAALDDYQRERLRLHDRPLPLQLVSPEDPGWELTWLARGHDVLGPHAWLIWMRRDLLAQQFTITTPVPDSRRPTLGFLAVDRVHGPPVARFWAFDTLSPAVVAAGLTRQNQTRVVFFTTLATIVDSDESDDFRGISPAFVLIDQSLEGFLDRTREGGALLSWQVVWLEGDRNVATFVFAHDQLHDVYFLLVASHSGYDAILAWLLRQPSEHVRHDPDLCAEHVAYLDALLHHLIGSFYELHLFAGTA